MKKLSVEPVSVSHCNPVYVQGRLKYWSVDVAYKGDLCLHHPVRSYEQLSSNQELRWKLSKEPLASEMQRYVLYSDEWLLNCDFYTVKYDDKADNTIISYKFRDGLFGRGAERAWQLRLKVLGQLLQQNKK